MTSADQDADFLAEVLPVFISEAHEQIASVEQLLLELEDNPADRTLLDALFRCAHTVKGSAGVFGLDPVVSFAHHMETMLDRVRSGEIALTPDLSSLLLACNDQLRVLIAAAQDPSADTPEAANTRAALVDRLQSVGPHGTSSHPALGPATVVATHDAPKARSAGVARWHVSVRFGPDTFRNGMDPLAIMSYLRTIGTVPGIACDIASVPPLDSIDAEACYLAFEFALETTEPRERIEDAFSFVRDDCVLNLVAPDASPQDFITLIAALPDHPRLGELLVAVGAITPEQLRDGLQHQSNASALTGRTAPLGEILQAKAGVSPQVVAAALEKQGQQRNARGTPAQADDNRYIRVHSSRLDEVINLVGELVIASAGASLLARQGGQPGLIEANQHVGRLVEEIRNGTLQLRMVPIGETFARFRRVVRDTAAELGKNVSLEISGGDTELDKSVVERIADPLMHLVRNALDHGFETPAERQAAGKPAQGLLEMSARHEAGAIVIEIADDGRGIDRQKVLARAWERGLVERDVVPRDEDILKLIFEAGFSTAEKVTNLSGRGVGMDVVRQNIEALRGTVGIASEPGRGTRMQLRLPLTLAIIDGFLIGVGTSKFVIPLEAVVEVIENRHAASKPDALGRCVVELRGQALPVVSLRSLYGLGSYPSGRASIVVIQAGACRYGVVVDQLFGQHQTVIKPLGRMFRSLRGMAGSSILGNGEVALIVDVHALGQLASRAADAHRDTASAAPNSRDSLPA